MSKKTADMSDLMTPRVIVTAHYPDSPFQVGDVLYKSYAQSWLTNEAHEVYTPDETFLNAVKAVEVEKATTCFKSLTWYEKRDIKDMPEYVKVDANDTELPNAVVKVEKWDFSEGSDCICDIEHEYYLSIGEETVIYPATATEYDNYIKQKI